MATEISAYPPRLAMIAADGARVGDALETAQGDCYGVSPTEHAAAFSFIEDTGDFHLIEFSAAGEVILDVKFPMQLDPADKNRCPTVALSDAGFVVVSFALVEGQDGSRFLHHIARDGTVTSEPWDSVPSSPRALAVQGESVIAVCQMAEAGIVVKRSQGENQSFPLEYWGQQILSEAGSLFLDVRAIIQDGVTLKEREILEIRCPD